MMSIFLFALSVWITIINGWTQIWCERDFNDTSDWVSNGLTTVSNDNNPCPTYGINWDTCGRLYSNNGSIAYMERSANVSEFFKLSIPYSYTIDPPLADDDEHYIEVHCWGTWFRILTLKYNSIYTMWEYLWSNCIGESNITIRYALNATGKSMYFNDVYLSGELTADPTMFPTINPSISSDNPTMFPWEICLEMLLAMLLVMLWVILLNRLS